MTGRGRPITDGQRGPGQHDPRVGGDRAVVVALGKAPGLVGGGHGRVEVALGHEYDGFTDLIGLTASGNLELYADDIGHEANNPYNLAPKTIGTNGWDGFNRIVA
jgi:hypothetical protein